MYNGHQSNNYSPNELSLGIIYDKIKNGQSISETNISYSEKSSIKFRKIKLPKCFDIIENNIFYTHEHNTFLSLLFGRIKYVSFDINCIIFGKMCDIYKIHKFMEKNKIDHIYYGDKINYFDNK